MLFHIISCITITNNSITYYFIIDVIYIVLFIIILICNYTYYMLLYRGIMVNIIINILFIY